MPFAASRDGSQIYFRHDEALPWVGRAAPAVLMHHGVALTGEAWSGWIPTLIGAGFQVIRLDMRGFGKSSSVAVDYVWSFDDFLDDIDAVTEAAGVKDYYFVGESLGGLIGLVAAIRRPEAVLGLGLLSCPFDGRRIGKAIDSWRSVIEKDGMTGWADMLMGQRFAPDFADDRMLNWVRDLQETCDGNAVAGQAEFIRKQDVTDDLPSIRAPALVMAPSGSPFVDPRQAAELQNRLAQAEIMWFPGHRHSLLMSSAETCARAFANFVQRRGKAHSDS